MFVFLPLGHDREVSRPPYFAMGVIAMCLVVQFWATMSWWYGVQGREVLDPVELGGYRPITGLHPNLVLYAFVHGGWLHVAGNMVFLYVTAFNLEDRWGRAVFVPFFLAAAVVAAMAFAAVHPTSSVPLVGASGAIAATMGAFLVCFHGAQIRMWYWIVFFRGTFFTRAYVVFPIWFGLELLSTIGEHHAAVAHSAHVGGFVFGLIFATLMSALGWDQQRRADLDKRQEVWSEEPDFITAAEHVERGDLVAARPVLERLVTARPDHLEGRLALARLLLHDGDPAAAAHASAAIDQSYWTNPSRASDLFAEFIEVTPDIALTDSALGHAAQAAHSERDIPRAFEATRRLLLAHPTSPHVPRAMINAAELQRQQGREDLAHRTLENLVEVFPDDPLAVGARELLGT